MVNLTERMASTVGKLMPLKLKPFARSLFNQTYYRNRNSVHPNLRKFGTVQDLCYWVSNEKLDTLLLLQNYFSIFYPTLDTGTTGTVTAFDNQGKRLATHTFDVTHLGGAKIRISDLIGEPPLGTDSYGTFEVNIRIPEAVLKHLQNEQSLYFWDRFYVGYTTNEGQTCFVHGVDKTNIYHHDSDLPVDWHRDSRNFEWAPEAPIDINDYKTLNIIMINRSSRSAEVSLKISDSSNSSKLWTRNIPARGVHQFRITSEEVQGLLHSDMRLRLSGIPTQFGRPVLFKEFQNGTISAMHC